MGKALVALLLLLAAPLRAEPVTIVAFGDSLTQGYGLVERDGLVPQLRRWLEEKGAQVTLINAGVSGDTTAGGAARIDWTLAEDVDGLIVALGGNDLLRGVDPAVSRTNLARILEAAEAAGVEVLLVGIRAPANYGPDFTRDFNAMYPELAEAHGALLHADIFAGLGEGTPDALREFFQPDGIHPNAEGVSKIVDDLGLSVLALIERLPQPES